MKPRHYMERDKRRFFEISRGKNKKQPVNYKDLKLEAEDMNENSGLLDQVGDSFSYLFDNIPSDDM